MEVQEKEQRIRGGFRDGPLSPGTVLWSGHATIRLAALPWDRPLLEAALAEGRIIEDYPAGHRALPDCLMLAFIGKEPLHAVVALDIKLERVLVVTIYRPDPTRWQDGYCKRR